ncbi:hypothetical protein I3J09_28200 (plasmid) [Streptomyces clavuligerus]|uniref:hypothetical protein n=1 Tax=Streptomyces clavuligerus TaxID=1901 RepID=UPI0001800971|nr:hypothetical protein [Streptomyces clavuligerus]ANW22614.1 hypothetical protein BB341_30380 [Streptomyces clavuligerus]AXU16917.1 hypothetical protein D1794_29630 [Streptomyces clavuligerus]EDY53356.1 hypothetical protein SSCG_06384 [Streptomyces clavuligerus]MBY6306805.1 hypothetical protein [Streptomyces clavuligerus]QCS10594.1 hypothetical protein CRV15_34255 [Streptomyces clavuligerus]
MTTARAPAPVRCTRAAAAHGSARGAGRAAAPRSPCRRTVPRAAVLRAITLVAAVLLAIAPVAAAPPAAACPDGKAAPSVAGLRGSDGTGEPTPPAGRPRRPPLPVPRGHGPGGHRHPDGGTGRSAGGGTGGAGSAGSASDATTDSAGGATGGAPADGTERVPVIGAGAPAHATALPRGDG